MQRHFLAENGRERLLGQIVQRGAEAAGRDDDVRALLGFAHDTLQTSRVVADDGLVIYVDAQLGQTLRDELRIGVDDVAQQDLRADGDEFCVHWMFLLMCFCGDYLIHHRLRRRSPALIQTAHGAEIRSEGYGLPKGEGYWVGAIRQKASPLGKLARPKGVTDEVLCGFRQFTADE